MGCARERAGGADAAAGGDCKPARAGSCRICLQSSPTSVLEAPCQCKGTMQVGGCTAKPRRAEAALAAVLCARTTGVLAVPLAVPAGVTRLAQRANQRNLQTCEPVCPHDGSTLPMAPQYAHHECVQRWIDERPPGQALLCEVCGAPFRSRLGWLEPPPRPGQAPGPLGGQLGGVLRFVLFGSPAGPWDAAPAAAHYSASASAWGLTLLLLALGVLLVRHLFRIVPDTGENRAVVLAPAEGSSLGSCLAFSRQQECSSLPGSSCVQQSC